MKKHILLVFIVFTFISTFSQKKKEISIYSKKNHQKIYVGLKKINGGFNEETKTYSSYDINNPKDIWFNKYRMKIIGDSVFMDKSAIFKRGKEIFSSESDGGFYFYRGIIYKEKNKRIIELEEFDCDYCPKIVVNEGEIPPKLKILYGEITKKGIIIDKILFNKIEFSKFKLESEYKK